jgi:serine/threonine protein kinase
MASTPPPPDLPATIGRYEVRRLVGEGSMGRVLLAHDPVLERDVAIKHLRSDLRIPRDVREGLVTRMQHEARAAARVAHPNLVVLHDMGEDADIGLYLVFEYVEGPTLKQRIAEGRLPPAEVAKLGRGLGEALTVAHEAGILHRDVKPENVILAKTGGKIADFGIARIPDSTLTHQGGLMGTPAYSAPETFKAGKFSPESDQFSLAATLYEALSGQRAFPGDDAVAVAAKISHEAPDRFAVSIGLSAAVDDALARALARASEDRFPSAAAFGAAFAAAIEADLRPAQGALASRDPSADPDLVLPSMGAPAAAKPRPRASEPPQERKLGQVLLGAAVVVVTATLLVRTALRSTEDGPTPADDPPAPSAAPTHDAGASSTRPRTPAPPRTAARPSASAAASAAAPGASATASPSADPAADAGITVPASAAVPGPAAPSGSAAAGANAGAKTAGGAKNDASPP